MKVEKNGGRWWLLPGREIYDHCLDIALNSRSTNEQKSHHYRLSSPEEAGIRRGWLMGEARGRGGTTGQGEATLTALRPEILTQIQQLRLSLK